MPVSWRDAAHQFRQGKSRASRTQDYPAICGQLKHDAIPFGQMRITGDSTRKAHRQTVSPFCDLRVGHMFLH